MCGIVGYWGRTSSISENVLISMLSAQAHRGPDGCGLSIWRKLNSLPLAWKGRNVKDISSKIRDTHCLLGLGHNWLAIQDRSVDAQMPLFSDDLRYCLVYNGEIYNYKDIRQKMIQEGYSFNTNSDAEVLLKAWQQNGPEILQTLRGMFAFLLFDSFEQTLWVVRDPFGMKPLYYSKHRDGIVFASEIRSLHANGLVKRSFNDEAVLAFLLAGVNKPGEDITFYDGIWEVPPGNVLKIREDNTEVDKYASLPELRPELTDDEAVDAVRKSVIDTVNAHLISERSVATCMSGGLDSTNVAAAIRHLYRGISCPYTVFSLGNSSGEDRELSLAVEAAQSLNIPHNIFRRPHVVPIANVIDMVITCETPNHVIGPINQYLLLRHISEQPDDIRVVLDGQGGDELMSGYPWFSKFLLDEIKKTNAILSEELNEKYNANLPLNRSVHEHLLRMFHDAGSWVRGFDQGLSALLNTKHDEVLQLNPVKFYLSNSDNWRGFRQREYFQGELQYLLRQEDRIGMRFGIECRVPYVDMPTIESVSLLRPEFLIKDGFLKYPLRVLFPEISSSVRWNTQKRGFWDVSDESFPYLRSLGIKAATNSPFINELVQKRNGDISVIHDLRPPALWRLLQIAILEQCSTSEMGLQWISKFDEIHPISESNLQT